MGEKTGYSIITYKLRLYCSQPQWLYETKRVYNLILSYYYRLLMEKPEIWDGPGQKLLRQLELLTIGSRGQDKTEILYPLPYEKIPLYFRRAAINDAIRLFKSYRSGEENGSQPAEDFQAAPIFYKGMYKDFTEAGISLKLWNGEKWVWEACTLDTCKRSLPEGGSYLSPTLKLEEKRAMLHVPVRQPVEDVRTVKERFPGEKKLCSAVFPENDCMAALVVLNKAGIYEESLFIRGGKQFLHKKKRLLNRIQKNRASMGMDNQRVGQLEEENKYLKRKIRNLSENYAHKVSRRIVDFCKEREISILVVPNYKAALNGNSYDWLGRRIIQYLRYKAFQEGMVVTSVGVGNTAFVCYQCGQAVKRSPETPGCGRNYSGWENYICPNGHKGNVHFNAAINLGRRFLKNIKTEKNNG